MSVSPFCRDISISFRVYSEAGWSLAGRAARDSYVLSLSSSSSQSCFLYSGALEGEGARDCAAHLPLSAGEL